MIQMIETMTLIKLFDGPSRLPSKKFRKRQFNEGSRLSCQLGNDHRMPIFIPCNAIILIKSLVNKATILKTDYPANS